MGRLLLLLRLLGLGLLNDLHGDEEDQGEDYATHNCANALLSFCCYARLISATFLVVVDSSILCVFI